ncbi:MAG: hypothetical protein QG625_2420, partial [Cyanobacteriota bacterium erpe_2018_sw_39hr_WHONDRS-SW48-000098_B_bin.30]|nr:hypothetical protein [Cyanobacteriota bacterium erpe_2018_sw_39hr_WHONDRS-SW48-000098_B_bin.30]
AGSHQGAWPDAVKDATFGFAGFDNGIKSGATLLHALAQGGGFLLLACNLSQLFEIFGYIADFVVVQYDSVKMAMCELGR